MDHAKSEDKNFCVQSPENLILKIWSYFWYCASGSICVDVSLKMCISFYAGHFDLWNQFYSFAFTSTHATSTSVIFNFWVVFYALILFPMATMVSKDVECRVMSLWIFLSMSKAWPRMPRRPSKNYKVDFSYLVPRKLFKIWYDFKIFLKRNKVI